MRLLAKCLLLAWLVVAIAYLPAAQAQTAVRDTDQSTRLTDYLHSHHLPLVGAQVLESRTGDQTVLLFGYTASDFGKSDAETKTRRFLKDTGITINNRILVRPELASMRSTAPSAAAAEAQPPSGEASQAPYGQGQPPSSGEAPPPDQLGGVQNYENQQPNNTQQQYVNQQTQQYMNQGNSGGGMNAMGGMINAGGGIASTLIPLIGMGLAIGLGGAGSGFGMGVSPGFGSSFGSSSPPNGYGVPYGGGGGYGAPYGASPYGNNSGTYP
jgi:hypothetical protein